MSRVIAMWSGPRNISTAMLRSWENRPDTTAWDEPLYPCFLKRTGVEHPGRDHVLEQHAHEIDYDQVAERLLSDVETPIFYQKHIAHHLLDDMDRAWMDDGRVDHCFLIRNPREMMLSLYKRYPEMVLRDTGLPQQFEIFQRCLEADGECPPVIDAREVLEDPRRTLGALCDRLAIPFDEAMLSWPAGPRDCDGAWADWWYDSVRASTRFTSWEPREGQLPPHLDTVLAECELLYGQLHEHRIRG